MDYLLEFKLRQGLISGTLNLQCHNEDHLISTLTEWLKTNTKGFSQTSEGKLIYFCTKNFKINRYLVSLKENTLHITYLEGRYIMRTF